MKTAAGGFAFAVVFFAVAAVSLAEARLARRLAGAHRQLATLQYAPADDIDDPMTSVTRVAGFGDSLQTDVERHRATIRYWRGEYDRLTPPVAGAASDRSAGSAVRLAAANAAFRASQPYAGDRRTAVERLDTVIQAYADVLRAHPDAGDAAFNYEYVVRYRDEVARTRGALPPRDRAGADQSRGASADLPAGPTVHGLPGSPPEGTRMEQFKTLSPMQPDERKEQQQPGRGGPPRRRG